MILQIPFIPDESDQVDLTRFFVKCFLRIKNNVSLSHDSRGVMNHGDSIRLGLTQFVCANAASAYEYSFRCWTIWL